jgi:guanylate kinase
MIARRGLCLVLAAPSGAGKSSIARALLAQDSRLSLSISVTTRAPRPKERDGEHYYFRDEAAFARMVDEGELLEHARVFGRFYGTPRAPVVEALTAGRDVLFDIDWQGFHQLRAALPGDVVGVFVLPPSLPALLSRMRGRAGDDEAEMARRMAAAKAEIAHWPEFEHVIVNDDFDAALAGVRAILQAARLATHRQPGLTDFVASLDHD